LNCLDFQLPNQIESSIESPTNQLLTFNLFLPEEIIPEYLMRRQDLHLFYINNYETMGNAESIFRGNYSSIRFFDFRFLQPNSIAIRIPFLISKIITFNQLKVYNQTYQRDFL
jgi:hypothetical protein